VSRAAGRLSGFPGSVSGRAAVVSGRTDAVSGLAAAVSGRLALVSGGGVVVPGRGSTESRCPAEEVDGDAVAESTLVSVGVMVSPGRHR
jgi:hypothetical protein